MDLDQENSKYFHQLAVFSDLNHLFFVYYKTYSVHIQRVHSEVVGVKVERLEQLSHGDLLPFQVVHDTVSVHTVRPLDEAQQMLLVHAGSCVDVSVHLGKAKK